VGVACALEARLSRRAGIPERSGKKGALTALGGRVAALGCNANHSSLAYASGDLPRGSLVARRVSEGTSRG
jgi:hypothetical protein